MVDWHLYPKEKPSDPGFYLVTVKYKGGSLDGQSIVRYLSWIGFGWIDSELNTFISNDSHRIVAWMKEPEPYIEETE